MKGLINVTRDAKNFFIVQVRFFSIHPEGLRVIYHAVRPSSLKRVRANASGFWIKNFDQTSDSMRYAIRCFFFFRFKVCEYNFLPRWPFLSAWKVFCWTLSPVRPTRTNSENLYKASFYINVCVFLFFTTAHSPSLKYPHRTKISNISVFCFSFIFATKWGVTRAVSISRQKKHETLSEVLKVSIEINRQKSRKIKEKIKLRGLSR